MRESANCGGDPNHRPDQTQYWQRPDEGTNQTVSGMDVFGIGSVVLFQNQAAIRRWLANRPVGNLDFDGQLRNSPGTVWLADKERAVPGRTVVVVLTPNRRFPEGFRIVTAYVDTP